MVYSGGIGDLDELMSSEVGVRVVEHSPESHRRAAAEILRLIDDPRTHAACRATADRRLSLMRVGIPAYLELYKALESILGSRQATSRLCQRRSWTAQNEGSGNGLRRVHRLSSSGVAPPGWLRGGRHRLLQRELCAQAKAAQSRAGSGVERFRVRPSGPLAR